MLVAFGAGDIRRPAEPVERALMTLSWRSLDPARSRDERCVAMRWRSTRTAVPQGGRLATADAAEGAPACTRECEGRAFGATGVVNPRRCPQPLIAGPADAEARTSLLARRFHNDAVRDTLALGGTTRLNCDATPVEPLCCQPISRSSSDPTRGARRSRGASPHLGAEVGRCG